MTNEAPQRSEYHRFRLESDRLLSYKGWPRVNPKPEILAAAGFYYTGEGDKVRCFECKIEICQWVESDDPMTEHKNWQEECRFVRNIPCGNVPLGVNPSSVPPPVTKGRGIRGAFGDDSECIAPIDFNSIQLSSSSNLSCLGISKPKGPSYPEYANYAARLTTFESWPKSMPQSKERLAEAGFYYTGKGDQTLCYYCHGGLKDWETDDDLWEEHAKLNPKCYHVTTVKGQSYVNQFTRQTIAVLSTEQIRQMNLPSYIKEAELQVTFETWAISDEGESFRCSEQRNMGNPPVKAGKPEASKIDKPEIPESNEVRSPKSKVTHDRLCKICYAEELGIVFLPCGHLVACVQCAPGMTTCALCRQPISMTVRSFFS